jgi:ABC-type sugar transport system substrate-binding protein
MGEGVVKRFIPIVAIVAILAVVGFLTTRGDDNSSSGGSEVAAQAPEDLKVVSSFNTLENDYFSAWNSGAESAAKALGIEYQAIVTDGDQQKEISGLEQAISSGANMIASVPIGAQSVPAMARVASQAGVPLTITWDIPEWYTPLDGGPTFAAYLRPGWDDAAYEVAKRLFEELDGKGQIIHLTGLPGTTGDQLVNSGVQRALKENPDIKVIARQPGKYNRVDSQQVMADLIAANPDFDGVFAQNDAEAIGALAALKEANHRIVPIVGMDGTKEVLDLIEQGEMTATISARPAWQAGYAVVRAYDAARGYKPAPGETMTFTGTTLVDKSNARTCLDLMNEPYDWRKMSRILHPDDWDPQNSVTAINPLDIWANAKKPGGYEFPSAYQDAIDNGDLDTLDGEYDSHLKADRPC